jgi:ParB family transcriptional regulator, chromosome partitioning protein
MAKNSIDVYGAKGKTNLLIFDPNELHLVVDPASPLFDKRVHLPMSESLVLNIMHHGVLQPVVVAKNTETGAVEVVAGRQRVKAAREANTRLRAQGCEPIFVPGVTRKSDGAALAGVMVSENELREDDTPLGRAEKMRHLAALGRDEAMLGIVFGCSPQTVRNTMALLDCCAAVRQAVAAGKLGVGHALKLSKMAAAEQHEKLGALLAVDGLNGHARARTQRAIVEPDAVRTRSRAAIAARRDGETGEWRAALSWALGE